MSGTIIFSPGHGVATSTINFDYLVERIRQSFDASDGDVISEIYDPLDQGGMTYISLADLSQEKFNAFVRAVRRAYSLAASDGSYHKFTVAWEELLAKLRADTRYLEDGL
ncbi:hypothetical protein KPL74_09080 [Bacillus sp. NP157]|nr:hypothetical protein KPL74_09080 [Bacillus sp. NP157]